MFLQSFKKANKKFSQKSCDMTLTFVTGCYRVTRATHAFLRSSKLNNILIESQTLTSRFVWSIHSRALLEVTYAESHMFILVWDLDTLYRHCNNNKVRDDTSHMYNGQIPIDVDRLKIDKLTTKATLSSATSGAKIHFVAELLLRLCRNGDTARFYWNTISLSAPPLMLLK